MSDEERNPYCEKWIELIRRCPLAIIGSEAELDRATEMANWLVDRMNSGLDQAEEEYLQPLFSLIEEYEIRTGAEPNDESTGLSRLSKRMGP